MTRTLLLLSIVALSASTQAQTIYKTVDEQGNINYSAEPPPEGARFEVLDDVPEPSDAQIEEAEERRRTLEVVPSDEHEPGAPAPQTSSAEATEGTGGADVMTDWRLKREEWKQRAFWGEQWPVHHPPHR